MLDPSVASPHAAHAELDCKVIPIAPYSNSTQQLGRQCTNKSATFVVISIQGWTDMWVSKHWIAASLSKYGKVYFVEPFRGIFLPGRGGRLTDFLFGPRIRNERQVHVVSMSSLPGHYSGPGWYRALSRLLMRRQLSRFERGMGESETYVLTFDCRSEPTIRQFKNIKKTAYYAIDRIPIEKNDPWWTEKRLIYYADEVLTTSERHRKRLTEVSGRDSIIVVPHGVDFDAAHSQQKTRPPDLPRGNPIIGYTGSIHDTYVDFDLVSRVAIERPEWNFVFVGPTRRNELSVGASSRIKELALLPNVHLLGAKPYSQLPSYISYFDVCIMPYALSVDNEPFKTLNYFAQGKPVVSANVPGVSEYRDLLYTYNNLREFLASLETALNESPAATARKGRIAFARMRDFSIICDRILEILTGQCCARSARAPARAR